MDAYIKYLGDQHDNYTRFGKVIPNYEKKIDVRKFFGCSEEREKFIINKLSSDSRIFFKVVKSAGGTARTVAVEQEEKIVAKEIEEAKKNVETPKYNVHKNKTRTGKTSRARTPMK